VAEDLNGVALCTAVSCIKDQVFSWRLSTQKKAGRGGEALREGTSLAPAGADQGDCLHERRKSRDGD
jgi:hypothetical protein